MHTAFSLTSISAGLLWLLAAAAIALAPAAARAQLLPAPIERPAPPAASLPYDAALAQYRRGDLADALASVEQALAQDRRDLRLRFLRAVVLSGLGRDAAAIEAFRSMADEFPELPEPHNNLAVLLAARGELDAAHRALQDALRASPGYALAHENLGDLHLRLAQRAYEQARQSDPASQPVATKLRLTAETVERVSRLAPAPAAPDPANLRRP
jgi:Tfp pilus assembly protein PilF